MDTIAFTARELSDPLLLIGTGEIKSRNVSGRIYFSFAEVDNIGTVRDFFPDSFVGI